MTTNLRPSIALMALAFACFSPTANAEGDDGWDWVVAPYLWAVNIGTDLQTTPPPSTGASTESDFGDVIDNLDGAFQIHAEGQGDRFGVFTDFSYLGLGHEGERAAFRTESDLDTRLFELAAVWNPADGRYRGFDVFAGLRYVDVDLTVQLDPVDPAFSTATVDAGDTYSDFMIGARYTWALSDRWGVTLRGDGSFGGTEGSWNTSAVANYRMKRGAWFFGYRYLTVELESANSQTEITLDGVQVGYGFIF